MRRRRPYAILLAAGAAMLACGPVATPSRPHSATIPTAIRPGDPLPDFELLDASAVPLTPDRLQGSVWLLSFLVPGAAQARPLLERVDDVYDRLGSDSDEFERYLVILGHSGDAAAPSTWTGWQSVRGADEEVDTLAARFGVVAWRDDEERPTQTTAVAVIGPDLRVAAWFGGLETWREFDLLSAIADASSLW